MTYLASGFIFLFFYFVFRFIKRFFYISKSEPRLCVNCPFFRNSTCFLIYMNEQDAPRGYPSAFCKYSDSDFNRISYETFQLRGGHFLPHWLD